MVGGGYAQPDEAITDASGLTAMMAHGHGWLNATFGPGSLPTVSWSLDPFGQTATAMALFKQMGYRGAVIDRIPHLDKTELIKRGSKEFLWDVLPPTGDGDESGTMLTSVLHHLASRALSQTDKLPFPAPIDLLYLAPDTFDFESKYPRFNPPTTAQNVDARGAHLARELRKRSVGGRTPNTLVLLGGDFRYQNATAEFSNMKPLVSWINDHSDELNMTAAFSTVGSFFDALAAAPPEGGFPRLGSDHSFLPYEWSPILPGYWSGYYFSHPQLKANTRRTDALLRAAEAFALIADLLPSSSFSSSSSSSSSAAVPVGGTLGSRLAAARDASGLMTHHDAVTGTSTLAVTAGLYDTLDAAAADSAAVLAAAAGPLLAAASAAAAPAPTARAPGAARRAAAASVWAHVGRGDGGGTLAGSAQLSAEAAGAAQLPRASPRGGGGGSDDDDETLVLAAANPMGSARTELVTLALPAAWLGLRVWASDLVPYNASVDTPSSAEASYGCVDPARPQQVTVAADGASATLSFLCGPLGPLSVTPFQVVATAASSSGGGNSSGSKDAPAAVMVQETVLLHGAPDPSASVVPAAARAAEGCGPGPTFNVTLAGGGAGSSLLFNASSGALCGIVVPGESHNGAGARGAAAEYLSYRPADDGTYIFRPRFGGDPVALFVPLSTAMASGPVVAYARQAMRRRDTGADARHGYVHGGGEGGEGKNGEGDSEGGDDDAGGWSLVQVLSLASRPADEDASGVGNGAASGVGVGVAHFVGNATAALAMGTELGWRAALGGMASARGVFFTDTNGAALQTRRFTADDVPAEPRGSSSVLRDEAVRRAVRTALGDDDASLDANGATDGGGGGASNDQDASDASGTAAATAAGEAAAPGVGPDDDAAFEGMAGVQRARALSKHTYPAGEGAAPCLRAIRMRGTNRRGCRAHRNAFLCVCCFFFLNIFPPK